MVTRSNIGLLLPNNKIASIYCHWDGYFDGVGQILLNDFTEVSKTFQLIQGGSISSLNSNIDGGENHTFDNPLENQTVFYKRDSGETDVDCRVVDIECFHNEEYSYYFDTVKGKWFCSDNGKTYNELTQDLINKNK